MSVTSCVTVVKIAYAHLADAELHIISRFPNTTRFTVTIMSLWAILQNKNYVKPFDDHKDWLDRFF